MAKLYLDFEDPEKLEKLIRSPSELHVSDLERELEEDQRYTLLGYLYQKVKRPGKALETWAKFVSSDK